MRAQLPVNTVMKPHEFSSYSPAIDIGQIEGAVAMGLGYYLTEEIKFDSKTGAIYNKNTWVREDKSGS